MSQQLCTPVFLEIHDDSLVDASNVHEYVGKNPSFVENHWHQRATGVRPAQTDLLKERRELGINRRIRSIGEECLFNSGLDRAHNAALGVHFVY